MYLFSVFCNELCTYDKERFAAPGCNQEYFHSLTASGELENVELKPYEKFAIVPIRGWSPSFFLLL